MNSISPFPLSNKISIEAQFALMKQNEMKFVILSDYKLLQ